MSEFLRPSAHRSCGGWADTSLVEVRVVGSSQGTGTQSPYGPTCRRACRLGRGDRLSLKAGSGSHSVAVGQRKDLLHTFTT